MPQALIESLDREGRGVAHVEGKTIFVDGAVTGEEVEYAPYRRKPSFELAQVLRIGRESSSRVAPRCAFFGTCGGCSMTRCGTSAACGPSRCCRRCTAFLGDTATARACRRASSRRRAGRSSAS